jgi:hypothetical protein
MSAPQLAPILAWPPAGRVLALAAAALLLLPAGAAAHARWRWPARGDVLFRFHYDPARRFARGQRRGIVVAARRGTRVRAACAGRVTFAGRVPRDGPVVAQACGQLSATYLGLGTIATARGRWLTPGADVGTVARVGLYALGARVRSRPDGYIDPMRLLDHGPAAGPKPAGRRPHPAPVPGRMPRIAPAPVPRRAPLSPAAHRAPVPRRTPLPPTPARGSRPQAARPAAPAANGLPLGGWWLPVGLALLAAAGLFGLGHRLLRRARRARLAAPGLRAPAGETARTGPVPPAGGR